MKNKIVSFKVAKAIAIPYLKSTFSEKIGEEDSEYSKVRVNEASNTYSFSSRYMRGDGKNTWGWSDFCFYHNKPFPTYLDVWLWLWREKKIIIDLLHEFNCDTGCFEKDVYCAAFNNSFVTDSYTDPEEAIIAAIEYLVDNDLIK